MCAKLRLQRVLILACLIFLFVCFPGEDEWRAEQRDGSEVSLQWSAETQDISVISDTYFPMYFVAPRRSFEN